MLFFLREPEPDVCRYSPDLVIDQGPSFTFYNFDVLSSNSPELTAKEREDRRIHIYPAPCNLTQIQDFFHKGLDLIGVTRRIEFLFDYLKWLDRGKTYLVIVHEEYRKPPFFWRRPWIKIDTEHSAFYNFHANISIPYTIKSVTRRII